MKLKNKVAIITGAGKGIGRETALLFAKEGAKVIAVSRTKEDLDKLSKELEKSGAECLTLACDLSNHEVIPEIVDKSIDKFGSVDILVNNAGIYLENQDTHSAADNDVKFNLDTIQNLISINQLSPWMLSVELINKAKKNLSIVNVASVNGVFGKGVSDIYDMAKSSVIIMTQNLAKEFAKNNVRVNCVNPSSTLTDMRNRAMSKYSPGVDRAEMDEMESKKIPFGRLGTSADIANAILFLASEDASYITGAVLNVDGGYLLNPKLMF